MKNKSEQLGSDNPHAVEVAKPLFDSQVAFVGLIERTNLNNQDDYWAPPWHTYYLCIQGTLVFKTENDNFNLKPGELCFIPSNTHHSRKSINSPVQFIYIRLYDYKTWDPLKKNGLYKRHYESADILFLVLRKILNAHKSRNILEINMALSYSSTFLELLKHELHLTNGPHSGVHQLKQIVTEIKAHPEKPWNTAQIASLLKVSKRKLTRMFIKEFGTPPYEMITKLRISLAAVELARGSENIANISSKLGYQSSYSFSTLFKKHTGLRPKDYRKQFSTYNHSII